ncbi:MAG: EI24 domain-containing protein [Alphaproteobacteria bacterium]
MLRDVVRTLGQVGDRRFARVLLLSLLLAAVLFAALLAAAAWAITSFAVFGIGWLDALTDLLGVLAVALVALLLFPAIAIAIQSVFLDEVAEAVERRWYPNQPPVRPQSWGEILRSNLELAAVVLVVNLMLLPVYLALLFVPPLNLVLFYLVNGLLLGREYFETVALRRMPPAAAKRARLRVRGHVWLAGALIAFLFSVPLLNLAAPVLGTALMLHMFQRLRGRLGEDGSPGPGSAPGSATGSVTGSAPGSVPVASAADGTRAMRAGMASVVLGGLILGGALQGWEGRPDDARSTAKPGQARVPHLPDELTGQGQIEVWTRLGSPDLVRREGPARVWQYATRTCVLDLYLYEAGDDFQVIHHALRARRPDATSGAAADAACYGALIERARGPAARPAAARPASRPF